MVGYNLSKQYFIAKNSFGPEWGNNGYCYIPFEYMKNESYDS
jgi:C1A family cysteine protease